jgi:CheY-like chemotaxis protein
MTEKVIRCPRCSASLKVRFTPGVLAVRVTCPKCQNVLGVRSRATVDTVPAGVPRVGFIGDEARPFRDFLHSELERAGFRVEVFEDGRELLERARIVKPALFVLNVYMRGMLGVEVCEAVKKDPDLGAAKVVFIGALFRANRYRSNPTNLYGADEYIEEIISADELRALLHDFFPPQGTHPPTAETPLEKELEEARRLARIIVSDLVLYHPDKVAQGIRSGSLEASLGAEITEARGYYDSRVSERVRQISSFFDDTLRDYAERRARTGGR